MEYKPVIFKLDGEEVEARIDNCEIALFRDLPDMDYIDIWLPPEEPDTETTHHWIFNQREKLIWMGRICVQKGDDKILRLSERQFGTFREHTGWNPQVLVEDSPSEKEKEIYTESEIEQLDYEWQHFNET